jgi:hypothetical protein
MNDFHRILVKLEEYIQARKRTKVNLNALYVFRQPCGYEQKDVSTSINKMFRN